MFSDEEFLREVKMKQGEAIRATQVGALANIMLAASKGSVGFFCFSFTPSSDGDNYYAQAYKKMLQFDDVIIFS